MITLRIVGPYPEEGFQDEDGVEHFNDVILAEPYGVVGNLKIDTQDEDDVAILQVPEVILVAKTFTEAPGSYVTTDGFGTRWLDVNARNGNIRYQILDDDVSWWDYPDRVENSHLALLAHSEWEPEGEYVEELRHEIIEIPVETSE